MSDTKEDCDKSANENWRLMREFERMGDSQRADDAARRAIEDEKCRDSWLYRNFGW